MKFNWLVPISSELNTFPLNEKESRAEEGILEKHVVYT